MNFSQKPVNILRSSYLRDYLASQIWSRSAYFFVDKIGGVPNAVRRDFIDEKARRDAQRWPPNSPLNMNSLVSKMQKFIGILFFFYSMFSFAFPTLQPIPRIPMETFRNQVFLNGGEKGSFNLENLRMSFHPGKHSYERWVIDFSDDKHGIGGAAPEFQIHYQGDSKIVIEFKSINKNLLNPKSILRLVRKSRKVKNIIVYPPVENGDRAIEIILKNKGEVFAHQPLEQEGRLVVDLR